jgi:iron complex transport system ATP-binding protein
MHGGSLAATGTPREVLQDHLLERVFDCRLVVGAVPANRIPFVLPQSADL